MLTCKGCFDTLVPPVKALVCQSTCFWQLSQLAEKWVAGAEALFADLGHFNRISMQISTMIMVYPCVLGSYLGQGGFAKA